MPTAADIEQTILNSNPSDWITNEIEWGLVDYIDDFGPTRIVSVYEHDVQLRIEQAQVAVKDFQEDWSDRYPDNRNNTSYSFWVVYDRSPLDHCVLVSVDGGRAWVPVPDRPNSSDDPWTISEYQNSIAGAVNRNYRDYQDRLDMGDIEVK